MRVSIPKSLLITALLGAFAGGPAAAQERSWFDRFDANDDGRITWSEYGRGMDNLHDRRSGGDGRYGRDSRFERSARMDKTGRFERRDDRSRDSRPRDSADRYDRGRDGQGSRSDYENYLRAEFKWLDRNDDGVLTRREVRNNAPGEFERDRRSNGRDRWN